MILLEIEDINNIEQVDILFEWHGRKRLSSELFSVWERLSGSKIDDKISMEARPRIYTNIVELQGMRRMDMSHWKPLK